MEANKGSISYSQEISSDNNYIRCKSFFRANILTEYNLNTLIITIIYIEVIASSSTSLPAPLSLSSLLSSSHVTDIFFLTHQSTTYIRTPGIDIGSYEVDGVGPLCIWDTAGQIEFHVTHSMFLGSANAMAVIPYDLRGGHGDVDVSIHKEHFNT